MSTASIMMILAVKVTIIIGLMAVVKLKKLGSFYPQSKQKEDDNIEK